MQTCDKTAKENASDVIVLTREEKSQQLNRMPANDPDLLGTKQVIAKVGEKRME